MFEMWTNVIIIFLCFLFIGIIIYLLGNRKVKEEGIKRETYTCGEKIPLVHVGAENFYEAIKKNLRVDEISKLHSGKLSDYILWLVIGLTLFLIAVILI